ncbi:MAG TPA: SDR family oxidoreductase, partial [Anaerolineales bacterium]|nr:SDR family oxidoreductase [Anaerolineales bacterium]
IAPGLILPSADIKEAEWQRLIDRLPLSRPGSTDDVAAALRFLLQNEYVTGQTLAVDGGYGLV